MKDQHKVVYNHEASGKIIDSSVNLFQIKSDKCGMHLYSGSFREYTLHNGHC